jgi:hypothetical protein
VEEEPPGRAFVVEAVRRLVGLTAVEGEGSSLISAKLPSRSAFLDRLDSPRRLDARVERPAISLKKAVAVTAIVRPAGPTRRTDPHEPDGAWPSSTDSLGAADQVAFAGMRPNRKKNRPGGIVAAREVEGRLL